MTAILIFLLIVFLFALIAGSIVIYSLKNGISPMPSSRKAKKALLHSIPKETQGPVYDLGSGWGTLIFALAAHLPTCKVIGVENSPFPYAICLLKSFLKRRENLELRFLNFYQSDISDAAIVICYLCPGSMNKLKNKFEKELKTGTLIISSTFALPGWKPIQTIDIGDLYHSKIYIYQK